MRPNDTECSLFLWSVCAHQIERVYKTVKSVRAAAKFGVSPFGLYRPGSSAGMPRPISGFDPYSALFADSLLWLQNGWVDFMAPQLYWTVNSTSHSFPMLLDWWLRHNPLNRCALRLFALQHRPTSHVPQTGATSHTRHVKNGQTIKTR